LPTDAKTLAHYFSEAGYDTGYIGKWHLADEEPVPESKRGGYGHWLASNILEFTSEAYSTTVYDNQNQPVKLPGYRVDALADAAIRYIAAHREQPFYLCVSFLEPHHQNSVDGYPAPDGYRERYMGRWVPPDLAALGGSTHQHLAGYYGMVKRLDEALGRLLDALKSLDLTGSTIMLFTSDHGCHFKTRNAEYKRSLHDASIRVPTALSGPGFDGGGEIQALVSLLDLPPTLLDAAGLAIPREMEGRTILPLVRNREQSAWPEEVFVQISESEVGRAVRTRRWKYGVVAPDRDAWEDAASDHYIEAYLYDLQVDPYELENLIGFKAYREVSNELRNRLLRRMVEADEKEPEITLAPTRTSGERWASPEDVNA
jgi:arylsulfatase A-like enzyme